MTAPSHQDLLRRARAGDRAAVAELVRLYEPEIRRYVRVRMTDPRLRRAVDSADIFQSVFAAFFVRYSAGQYDLGEPEQLVRLLFRMARNKMIDYARKADQRRTRDGDSALWQGVVSPDETPSRVLAERELLDEVRRRLTDEERLLAERRADGLGWREIAAELGGSPEALRKRLERGLDRVCRELGIDETPDE